MILAVFMAAVAQPSLAADLASQKAAPEIAAPLPRWAGLYIGFNRGFGGGVVDGSEFLPSLSQGVGVFAQTENRASGFIAGGQIGYNHQFANRFIIGGEADFQWSGIKASYQSTGLSNSSSLNSNVDSRIGLNWFGTARGRVGYSLGRLSPYVTGGLLYGQLQGAGTPFLGSNSIVLGALNQTKLGWVMGGGVDIAITKNLSARSEYLYLSMSGVSGPASGAVLAPLTPVNGTFGVYGFGAHLVRAGLNYRLTGLDRTVDFEDIDPLLKGDVAGFLSSAPTTDWAGFYAGVNGGYGGDVINEYASLYQQSTSGSTATAATVVYANRTGGFLGGGQVGYNYQIAKNFILGAETDAQWTGITGQHESLTLERPTSAIYVNRRSSLDWYGTTRLRAGVTRGDLFGYFTAGVSYGQVSSDGYQLTNGLLSNRLTQTKAGWVVGLGSEYSITSDLSFKAEYLYLSMSGINGASTGAVLTDQSVLMGNYTTGTITNSLMRVGANWKFGRANEDPISVKP